MIVVDASVLANAIADDEHDGEHARALLREQHQLAAPDLIDGEVTAVLRRRWLAGSLNDERFHQAITDLADFPLTRYPTRRMMHRAFALRANVTAYDSCYITLAEALECSLYTADARLSRASGPRCTRALVQSATTPQPRSSE